MLGHEQLIMLDKIDSQIKEKGRKPVVSIGETGFYKNKRKYVQVFSVW